MQILPASLLFQPRTTVNTRIVVVGASDTGLSFLESLVYTSHLYFTGLVLITDDDYPATESYNNFVSHRIYSPRASKQIGLENYIQVIKGSAFKIERDKKRVRTVDGKILPYDYLFLTSGIQFQSSSIHVDFCNLSGVINLNRRENLKILAAADKIVMNSGDTLSQIVL
jgi:hypothetical protein